MQVHELTNALTLARSDLASTEAERVRLKELHSQVKAALQDSYSRQQEQQKQVGCVYGTAGLCAACCKRMCFGAEPFMHCKRGRAPGSKSTAVQNMWHAAIHAKKQHFA